MDINLQFRGRRCEDVPGASALIHFRGITDLGQGVDHGLRVHVTLHGGAAAFEIELGADITGQFRQRLGRLGDATAAYIL